MGRNFSSYQREYDNMSPEDGVECPDCCALLNSDSECQECKANTIKEEMKSIKSSFSSIDEIDSELYAQIDEFLQDIADGKTLGEFIEDIEFLTIEGTV